MRGTPLLRTFLVFLAIIAAGYGFFRLTSHNSEAPLSQEIVPPNIADSASKKARFFLTFSSSPESLELTAGDEPIELISENGGDFIASAELNSEGEVIFLKANWKASPSGEKSRNFAKLIIEVEGEKTITRVFDSMDDIDDFVELPF